MARINTDPIHVIGRLHALAIKDDGEPYERLPVSHAHKALHIIITLLLPALWARTRNASRKARRNGSRVS